MKSQRNYKDKREREYINYMIFKSREYTIAIKYDLKIRTEFEKIVKSKRGKTQKRGKGRQDSI